MLISRERKANVKPSATRVSGTAAWIVEASARGDPSEPSNMAPAVAATS
jgi:hypothetical protein